MLGNPKEYTNLQIACGLAVESYQTPGAPDPNTRERLEGDEEWVELRGRGKSNDEIDQMRLLIKQIAGWMKPIVCMAEDDIELGLGMGVSQGLITPAQQAEMVATLLQFAHLDPPVT